MKMSFKVFILLAVAVGVAYGQVCGNPATAPSLGGFNGFITRFGQKLSPRIVGGQEALPHSWPWQVSLQLPGGSCGGTIISNEWIMTAAHCCVDRRPANYRIRIGAHNLQSSAENNAKNIRISRVVPHPQYSSYPVLQNDFCLLKTTEPMVFNKDVAPVCMPDESDGPTGQQCFVSGWGSTAQSLFPYGGSFFGDLQETIVRNPKTVARATASKLQQVSVQITDQSVCAAAYRNTSLPARYRVNLTPEMICANSVGKDSCQGDSGGPLVCQDEAGLFKLVGVVSWGYGCADPRFPGVYARTITALDWITSTIFTF